MSCPSGIRNITLPNGRFGPILPARPGAATLLSKAARRRHMYDSAHSEQKE